MDTGWLMYWRPDLVQPTMQADFLYAKILKKSFQPGHLEGQKIILFLYTQN